MEGENIFVKPVEGPVLCDLIDLGEEFGVTTQLYYDNKILNILQSLPLFNTQYNYIESSTSLFHKNYIGMNKRCIQTVAIQMYKIKNQTAPIFMQNLFVRRQSQYEMRDNDVYNIPRFKTVTYGKKSFRYYGAK